MPPLAWLEAMARETCVVVPKVRGLEQTIIDGQTGYTLSDIGEWRVKAAKILDNVHLHRLKKRARQVAMKRHSVVSAARQYEDMWSRLCS